MGQLVYDARTEAERLQQQEQKLLAEATIFARQLKETASKVVLVRRRLRVVQQDSDLEQGSSELTTVVQEVQARVNREKEPEPEPPMTD